MISAMNTLFLGLDKDMIDGFLAAHEQVPHYVLIIHTVIEVIGYPRYDTFLE
jgi:hypothetical protein